MSKGLEALHRIGKQKYKTTVADITGFETITISVKQDNKKDYNIIEKELKALNEILALHNKWLGNEMSDFEFFTLLSEVKDKYDLLKEVLL